MKCELCQSYDATPINFFGCYLATLCSPCARIITTRTTNTDWAKEWRRLEATFRAQIDRGHGEDAARTWEAVVTLHKTIIREMDTITRIVAQALKDD